MTKYESLLDIIDQSDIVYIETDSENQPAKAMRNEDGCAIFFNEQEFKTTATRLIALAHEKGHCDSRAFYSIHTPLITREICERRAWRRAILDQLPFDKLMEAFEACKTADRVTVFDLSEYLDLPEDFIIRAIEDYMQMGKQIS